VPLSPHATCTSYRRHPIRVVDVVLLYIVVLSVLIPILLSNISRDHIGESIVYIWVEKLREVLEEEQQEDHKSDLKEEEDGNVSQQEKNPISDKLIASVSRLDCSDSTTTNNQNTPNNSYDSSKGTSLSNSFLLASHLSHKNKTLVGCKIPNITTGQPFTDRKSTFQAHLTPLDSVVQVR